MAATTFRLISGATGHYWPIITDRQWGGLEWHYASSGRNSPFRVVLPVFDDREDLVNPIFTTGNFTWYSLIDTADRQYTTNNGWAIRGGDEIYITVQTPHDVQARTIFNGVVIDVEIIVSEEHERLLAISGVSWGDFWLDGRVFDGDYRTKTTRVSDVIHDVVVATHPSMGIIGRLEPTNLLDTAEKIHLYMEARDPGSDVQVQKEYVPGKCSDALQDLCALANLEYFVNTSRQLVIHPADGYGTSVIHEYNIVGKPKLRWTDDGYHYDKVWIGTSNEMFAPNNASPTGTAYCDTIEYWTARELAGNVSTDKLYIGFCQKVAVIGGCYPGIVLGYKADFLQEADSVAVTLSAPIVSTSSTDATAGAQFLFNMVESDWDSLQFGLQNNFNLVGFYVKLNHGRHGATGNYTSANLVDNEDWPAFDPSVNINKFWNLRLPSAAIAAPALTSLAPSTRLYDTNFWLANGDAGQDTFRIDEVEFQLFATGSLSMSLSNPTIISYLHFSKTPQAVDTVAAPRTPPRISLQIDRTETSDVDLATLATTEKDRIKDSMLSGTITVNVPADSNGLSPTYDCGGNAGEFYFQNNMTMMPGSIATLELPYYGFDGLSARSLRRVDHMVHNVVDNEWVCTIAFGQFNTTNTLDIYHMFHEIMGDTKVAETASKTKSQVATGKIGSGPAGQIKGKHNLRGYR